ncbi:MAG TPA: hypothetical protein HPP64_11485 [Gammaproteobacteria bacterium]|nr:hypothetical protein [Gammaproteobacteria bacterium]
MAGEKYPVLRSLTVLPQMSGAELLRKITLERRFETLAVMIFTESPDEEAYQLVGRSR